MIDVLEGLVITLSTEAERELFGWRFTVFQEVGGQDLIRSLSTRLTLLKQARDVIKVVFKLLTDPKVSPHKRVVLDGFIKTNSEWAKRGILTENWFENTIDTLTRLEISIQPEDLTGIYGLDLETERGSSPERISSPEILRGQDQEVSVDLESEIVMVYGRGLDRVRDLEEENVFGNETSTKPPILTSSASSSPSSEPEEGIRRIKLTDGLEENRLVEELSGGGLIVTRVFPSTVETSGNTAAGLSERFLGYKYFDETSDSSDG